MEIVFFQIFFILIVFIDSHPLLIHNIRTEPLELNQGQSDQMVPMTSEYKIAGFNRAMVIFLKNCQEVSPSISAASKAAVRCFCISDQGKDCEPKNAIP